MTDLLADIQAAIFHRLLSYSPLATVPMLQRGKEDMAGRVAEALAGKIKREGQSKSGAFIAVQSVDIAAATGQAPRPLLDVVAVIEIGEDVIKNAGSRGTGITAGAMVAHVTSLFHNSHIESIGTGIRLADTNPVAEINLPAGEKGFLVTLAIDQVCFDAVDRTGHVSFAEDEAGEILLSCDTTGTTIYYTTDGSYPGSGNPDAITYSAPFPPGGGTVLNAAAEKDGEVPSLHVNSYTVQN